MIIPGTSSGLLVNVMVLLIEVSGVAQLLLPVMITRTCSPAIRVLLVNVLLLVPALTPFTCHWNAGLVPPFTGIAVNVMTDPGHTAWFEVVIDTDAVTAVPAVMVSVLLVAVSGLAQDVLRVSIAFTCAPFARLLLVKILLFVPGLMPLTCH